MKVYNIVRYDQQEIGEDCRILFTYADRDKAEERINHLYKQFNPTNDESPTFHVVTKKVIGERKIEKEVLAKYRKK